VVAGHHDLGVALGAELGAERLRQLPAQLDVVVDLSVVRQQVPPRLRPADRVREGLVAELHVDDRQALVGEDHVLVGEHDAGVVGSAVVLVLEGGRDRLRVVRRGPGVADEHEHSAHGRHPPTG
jgi:hypothetical protein